MSGGLHVGRDPTTRRGLASSDYGMCDALSPSPTLATLFPQPHDVTSNIKSVARAEPEAAQTQTDAALVKGQQHMAGSKGLQLYNSFKMVRENEDAAGKRWQEAAETKAWVSSSL